MNHLLCIGKKPDGETFWTICSDLYTDFNYIQTLNLILIPTVLCSGWGELTLDAFWIMQD